MSHSSEARRTDEILLRLTGGAGSQDDDPMLTADRLALSLSFARHRLLVPLARAASAFLHEKEWFRFGYARLEDHARERFRRSSRWVRDLGALAEAIERLPALARAIGAEDGHPTLRYVVALLIGRVATAETCGAWISLGRHLTVREFREEVRKARQAASPWPAGSAHVDGVLDHDADAGRKRGDLDNEGDGGRNAGHEDELGAEDSDVGTIRLAVPHEVRVAFDEARDLYSAVTGGAADLSGFVEALIAEAKTDEVSPLAADSTGRRLAPACRERLLALASDAWVCLREASDDDGLLAEAGAALDQVDRFCSESTERTMDPDARIRALLELDDEVERRLGEILAQMGESGAWRALQFASLAHYGEERLGISRSSAKDRARLARALREQPIVSKAYHEGRIGSEAASLLQMVLGRAPEGRIEAAWVEHAERSSVKRLRDEVRLLARDGAPGGRCSAELPPDDARWQRSLARAPGRSIERLARCAIEAAEHPLDLEVLPLRLPLDLAAELLAAIWTKRRGIEAILRADRGSLRKPAGASDMAALPGQTFSIGATTLGEATPPGQTFSIGSMTLGEATPPGQTFSIGATTLGEATPPGQTFSIGAMTLGAARKFADTFHHTFAAEWVGLLALIEDFVRTWDDPRGIPKRAGDEVYVRDGWRCSAPGCTSRQNLEDHHIVYRARGGSDELSNRITLCRFHHQQGEHGDLMICHGEAPLGLEWELGLNGRGGLFRNERLLAAVRCDTLSSRRHGSPRGEVLEWPNRAAC